MAILSVSHRKHSLCVQYVGRRVNVRGKQWLCVLKEIRNINTLRGKSAAVPTCESGRCLLILIYLLTAIWLSPGGSSTVHIYTQTIHRTTQITINVVEGEPCPVFESFTLAFALQLRKKHGKTSVRVRKTSVTVQKPIEC